MDCIFVALRLSYVRTQRDNVIAHPIILANVTRAKRGNAEMRLLSPATAVAPHCLPPPRLEFIYYSRE